MHENLPRILTPVFPIQTRHAVLFGVITFFERLERRHEVVPAGDAGGDDAFGDASGHGAFDDCGDGVHGADDFGLELGWDVEFDLFEEVFRGTEATDYEDVLINRTY